MKQPEARERRRGALSAARIEQGLFLSTLWISGDSLAANEGGAQDSAAVPFKLFTLMRTRPSLQFSLRNLWTQLGKPAQR